jgi:outer membrane receptor for ferric coprogen and ferric-rhodotorulic acid
MAAYLVTEKFSLALNGTNLANTYYYTNSYFSSPMENHVVPGVGRTFLLTGVYSFE